MTRLLSACLFGIAVCLGALISVAQGDDLKFSLFATPPATSVAPLEFSMFEPVVTEHTALRFSLFDDSETKTRERQVLHFTAEWCGACKSCKPTLDALRKVGWDVGPHATAQIRVVDFDGHTELAEEHGVTGLPTWIGLHKGRPVAKRAGYLDAWQVGRLYDPSTASVAAR